MSSGPAIEPALIDPKGLEVLEAMAETDAALDPDQVRRLIAHIKALELELVRHDAQRERTDPSLQPPLSVTS